MANVTIDAAPEAEIDEARAYLRQDSERASAEFLAEVRHVPRLIADAPKQWPQYSRRYRFFALRKHAYVIYYRIVGDHTVRIVAVAHSSRRPDYWKGR
jgi:plasmid stabilization system protein ParE